jgi:hypothetical protein
MSRIFLSQSAIHVRMLYTVQQTLRLMFSNLIHWGVKIHETKVQHTLICPKGLLKQADP